MSVLSPLSKKIRKNTRRVKNYFQHFTNDHLEPIEEEGASTKNLQNCPENSLINSNEPIENVSIERIFFKENPFRVCGYMKVKTFDMFFPQ